MNGVNRLRQFAKARRLRVLTRPTGDASIPEPLEIAVSTVRDGTKVILRASPSYLSVESPVKTSLVFSVGTPNKVLQIDLATDVSLPSGHAVYISRFRPSTLAKSWLANETHRHVLLALLARRCYGVHAFRNGVKYVGSPEDLEDDLIADVVAFQREVATAAEEVPRLDVSMLPTELADFVREFEPLAEGDDELRDELRKGLIGTNRRRFLRAATPLFPALNHYLDTLPGTWPEAAIKLSQLGELASEIQAEE